MKYAILLASSAALALGACQNSDTAAPEASDTAAADTTETTAAPAAGAATFAAGQPPSPEFMVGTWGEGDACEMPINFEAGGKIKDGPFDTWEIVDGQLVMGGLVKLKLTVVDQDTMESVPEGSTETSTLKRCG
jgi:hypothetical protein